MPSSSSTTQPPTPHRQIRAKYDDRTITVYQAYSAAIAVPAVQQQKLNASPSFKPDRMTWIKPSWGWMMYRSGYSHKDANQAHILALTMTHASFRTLLSLASVTPGHGKTMTAEQKSKPVRVQWDPERSAMTMQVLPYRSIQIGVSGEVRRKWVEEWIEGIEDVTAMARGLKGAIDAGEVGGEEEMVERGLVPRERVYEVAGELRGVLEMDWKDR